MTGSLADPRRAMLLDFFHAALAAVDGRRRVRAALATWRVERPVSAVAAGKAAAAMMLGALDALGPRLARGLVIAPDGELPAELLAHPAMQCLTGGHPLPDERSLAAGRQLLEFASDTRPGSLVLLMVSGGASALVEAPAPGVTLGQLRVLSERALSQGLDIVTLNAKRSALSLIKGGRLPSRFRDCELRGLMISDVPRDDPAVVGSGLLAAGNCPVTLVGCLDDALDAVTRAARARGLSVARASARLGGEAETAARRICHELAVGADELQVHGGETVVRLPERPGRGGRCQHLALAAARAIAGHPEYLLLAAGSDGRDGASEDAGAIVDGETLQRGIDGGFDSAEYLARADSGALLEAAGDLLYTGPTGTNVGDIVLALRQPPAEEPPM